MQNNNILNLLVESGAISQTRADILAGLKVPGCAYSLYKDEGMEHFDDASTVSDEELKLLVQFENLLTEEIPVQDRNVVVPLLLVVLARLIEFIKNPSELKQAALEDAFTSYKPTREELLKEIEKATLEQIDQYVCKYKRHVIKKQLK